MVCYVWKLSVIFLVSLPVYLLIRRPWSKKQKGKVAMWREFVLGCFILFHEGLLVLALEGKYGSPAQMAGWAAERLAAGDGINFIPFCTIGIFFSQGDVDVFMVNIVGNIVMFMPWGFGLVLLWKRKQNVLSVIGHSLLFTLFIEVSQLFIGRSVDVDDLILNFFGSCLGASVYFLLRKCFSKIGELAVE